MAARWPPLAFEGIFLSGHVDELFVKQDVVELQGEISGQYFMELSL